MSNTDNEEPVAPKLSPQLRDVLANLRENSEALAQQLLTKIRSSIDDYGSASETTRLDSLESLRVNMKSWFDTLIEGKKLTDETLAWLEPFARRRVHQGISLAAMLRAYRYGPQAIWIMTLDAVKGNRKLMEELLFNVSPFLLYYWDAAAQMAAQTYMQEEHQRLRWRDRLRHELNAIIFSNPDNIEGFRTHAQALGIDSSAPHTALALRTTDALGATSDDRDRLDPLLISVARVLGRSSDTLLYAVRNAHLILWIPVPPGKAILHYERELAERATKMVAAKLRIAAVGIGLPTTKPQGWQVSADQAMKAIDAGLKLKPEERVHHYSDIVVDDAVMSLENVAVFFNAVIERLSVETGLLETLQTYFELGQHRKAVAGRLNIHPNTLDYRLSQIENLLDAQLSDIGWQTKLHTALRLHRLSMASRY